ncbi:MAG: type II toxin-antitoxin system PemK/MazF family toxin [Bacteroidota bacterium]
MDMVIKRADIWMVSLDPTIGREIKKIRPCMIISPDEANKYLDTVMIAPLTSTVRQYPSRVNCTFNNKKGQIVIDQIRAVDKIRLVKKLGIIDEKTAVEVFNILQAYFDY